MRSVTLVVAMLSLAAFVTAARAQSGDETIDECGVLVRVGSCVLFEGAGGRFLLSDYGDYREGDLVRVVGAVDENCITICPEADGCVRGAEVFDPLVFPCGEPLPNFPGDICTGVAGGLTLAGLGGLALASRRLPRRRTLQ